jgi:hypothetical protein
MESLGNEIGLHVKLKFGFYAEKCWDTTLFQLLLQLRGAYDRLHRLCFHKLTQMPFDNQVRLDHAVRTTPPFGSSAMEED